MAEILSPAGGTEQAVAAVRCGADAIYLGLKKFSARAGAVNFDEQQLRETVGYCHRRGVKVYAAVNTMLFDSELSELEDTLQLLCEIGVDAVISQDLAMVSMARRCCPELELHASTQMTLHTAFGCEFASRLGFKRAVLSRELPMEIIASLSGGGINGMETEVFVHGALCMSVSGQCLMSAMVGGRSANRGGCAQPCRLPCSVKKGGDDYALSLKDMSVLPELPELAAAGVDSMKIEGRMKRPEYAALSAYCATKAINGEDYDARLLEKVFSRGGFTDGYLKGKRGGGMFGRRTAEDSKETNAAYPKIHELYRHERKCSGLTFDVTIKQDEQVRITARDENGLFAEFTADPPQQAVNRPCDEQLVLKQLSKLGNTFYELVSIRCEIDDDLSVSPSVLNTARRELCERLTALREEHYSRAVHFEKLPPENQERHTASDAKTIRINAQKAAQLTKLDPEDTELVFLPLGLNELRRALELFPADKLGVCMPRFTFDEQRDIQKLKEVQKLGIGHMLCTNFAHIIIAERLGLTAHAGSGLNTANTEALRMLDELGASSAMLSPEMKVGQINSLGGDIRRGVIAYGRLPLMLTVNCPIMGQVGCKGCTGRVYDRTGRAFPVRCSKAQGYTELLNSDLLCISDKQADFVGADFFQIELNEESPERAAEIISLFKNGRQLKNSGTVTRGLYYRGVK